MEPVCEIELEKQIKEQKRDAGRMEKERRLKVSEIERSTRDELLLPHSSTATFFQLSF